MSDITDAELKRALTEIDILLKRKQAFWETPRNLALILTAVAAIAGLIGFRLGGQPQQITATLRFEQPLSVKTIP